MRSRIAKHVGAGLLLLGGLAVAAGASPMLTIPTGAAPTLDGILSEGEWGDALELALADGVSLHLKHHGGFLYLGVGAARGAEVVGNVYIARYETVEILHASHALGSATYRLADGRWQLERSFSWSCRALGFSDEALAEREAFLETHGWLATVVNLGRQEETEYKIAFEDASMTMLFRFDVHRTEREVLTWPLETDVGLSPGPLLQEATFRPDTWCVVSLAPSEVLIHTVPSGSMPVLDGTLSAGEWDDALRIALDARTTLSLKHAEGALFLGLSARTTGVVSPCVVRGSDVWVLHASAALGTAIYGQDGETWRQSEGFSWDCRTTGFGEQALAEREAFLAREGWLGTIGYLGAPTHFEVRVELLDRDSMTILFLFLFLGSGFPRQVVTWPDLEEPGDYAELITGPVPENVAFDVTTWARLAFERGDEPGSSPGS